MPRVKPLAKKHRVETEVAKVIGTIMVDGKMSIRDLSKKIGVDESTLGKRIGKNGDLGNLRLKEFIRILELGEWMGIIDKGEQQ